MLRLSAVVLDNEWSMWNTLGMTGNWSEDTRKHPRVKLTLNDGDIFFNDQRNFGTVKFVKGKFTLIQKLKSLGPDMLVDEVTDQQFIERLRKKDAWQITTALMNQAVVAGVGNYIKAEALWLARISPHRRVSELSDERLSVLNGSIKTVMKESFKSGGATIRSYKNFNGEDGEYSRRFLVYNQKADPDGNEVIREMTEDQRTTHWCPSVQH
jgi:formamidopyrimidine-DNA glycosylase